jgi:hypothetical protein
MITLDAMSPGWVTVRYVGRRYAPRPRMNGFQQALEQACGTVGLDPDGARLLRLGSNAVTTSRRPSSPGSLVLAPTSLPSSAPSLSPAG